MTNSKPKLFIIALILVISLGFVITSIGINDSGVSKTELQKEADAGKEFDETSNAIEKDSPIVSSLPLLDPNYRIDYGVSVKYPNNPKRIAIFIKSSSVQGRTAALNWMKDQGFDPTDYEIVFPDFAGNLYDASPQKDEGALDGDNL